MDEALLLSSPEGVQGASLAHVLALKRALRHGDGATWDTQAEGWLSGNESKSLKRVDIRARIEHHLTCLGADETELDRRCDSRVRFRAILLDAAELFVLRYLVLLRMGPVGLGLRARHTPLRPSNIASVAYGPAPLLAALGVSACLRAPPSLEAVQSTDWNLLAEIRIEEATTYGDACELELERMRVLGVKGLWRDVPRSTEVELASVTAVKGDAESIQDEAGVDSHLPLPDDYVSAMGTRSLWLVEDLGPDILKVAELIRRIWEETAQLTLQPTGIAKRRTVAVGHLLRAYIWRDSAGRSIHAPPFLLRLPSLGKNSQRSRQHAKGRAIEEPAMWPPRTLVDVLGLMNLLQAAHIFLTEMSIAARRGELGSMPRDCVVRTPQGLNKAKGRTYKLVERSGGKVRDWVLPSIAEKAIEQQARLVAIAEQIGAKEPNKYEAGRQVHSAGNHLWGQLGVGATSDPKSPLLDVNRALCSYAEALGMSVEPGGQRLRSHRFRKTLARLVGLAIAEAPRVLMQVFGHASVDSVLYYVLADRAFQLEVSAVARAVRVAKATEVVEAMVLAEESQLEESLLNGGYGGQAAPGIAKAVYDHKQSLHESGQAWGADNARKLAEVFTLQGREWLLVRQGVLCTKLAGQAGPCNKSLGRPEPSKCGSTCMHRLEEPFLRADTDSAIKSAVEELSDCEEKGDTLMAPFWAGQIRMHLERFPDIKHKWASHPIVARAVATAADA